MREDDHNIILRKHREVQRYIVSKIYPRISTRSSSKQISTQTIYYHVQGLFPVANPSIRRLPIGSNSYEHCQMIGS